MLHRAVLVALIAAAPLAQADARDVWEAEALEAYDQGDAARAAALWTRAAEAGAPDAMTALAALLADGDGIARDPEAATLWLRRAAAAGEAHAMVLLALGEDDPSRAETLFARAAALGHPFALRRRAQPSGPVGVVTPDGVGDKP